MKYEVRKKLNQFTTESVLVGVYSTRNRAENKVNKINQEYGCYIAYKVKIAE